MFLVLGTGRYQPVQSLQDLASWTSSFSRLLDIEEKKLKLLEAELQAEREAKEKGEERERREKLLEESKSIVLVEDSSLPKATKVYL